jgi:rare lipoprotein A
MGKMQMTRARALFGCLALVAAAGGMLSGCAGTGVRGGSPNWREQGLASWYGSDFHGRRTANGERYNMYAMTAAHKTLPLGTQVVVTSRETGRRIRVRVNDRGPFVAGRVIDLSLAAARALGSAEAGVVPVTLEAYLPASAFAGAAATTAAVPSIKAGPAPPAPAGERPLAPPLRGAFAVQVGAFAVESNARKLAARLPVPPGAAHVLPFEDNRGTWWRVRVGGYPDELAASTAAAALEEIGLPGFIVRED